MVRGVPVFQYCLCVTPSAVLCCHLQGGILALDLSPSGEGVVATAGGDASVQVYDRAAERILASLTGHSKKVHGEL